MTTLIAQTLKRQHEGEYEIATKKRKLSNPEDKENAEFSPVTSKFSSLSGSVLAQLRSRVPEVTTKTSASDEYLSFKVGEAFDIESDDGSYEDSSSDSDEFDYVEDGAEAYEAREVMNELNLTSNTDCLLYTSPSPRDQRGSRMPSSA